MSVLVRNSKDRFSLEAAQNNIIHLYYWFPYFREWWDWPLESFGLEEKRIFFFFKVVYDLFLHQFTRWLGIF